MMFATIDLVLTSGTTALLLLLVALLLRDARQSVSGGLAVALAVGCVAQAIAAGGIVAPVATWRAPLIALATANVVVFWLFARALFDDAFVLRGWHGVLWAAVAALSLIDCLLLVPRDLALAQWVGAALTMIALGFIGHVVFQAIASWSVDLVESRRRVRLFIVIAAAAYGVINALMHLLPLGAEQPELMTVIDHALFVLIVAGVGFALTTVGGASLLSSAPAGAVAVAAPSAGQAAADRRLIDALNRLMTDERIYRHEGVTIGKLATRLGVPEYKLRRLINQQLGYRNFNAFLNNHRIAEAKSALADPTQAEVPVITIAMDAGFQSLGPFNRAFKTMTGVTPTEYRRRELVSA